MRLDVGVERVRSREIQVAQNSAAHWRTHGLLLRLLTIAVVVMLLPVLASCQNPRAKAEDLAAQSQLLEQAGDLPGAVQAIKDAIELRDDVPAYFLRLSGLQMRAGNPQGAFSAVTRALELDAANVEALTAQANIGLQIGELDMAMAAADRLLALDPGSLMGLQVKGLASLHMSKNADAESAAKRLMELSPLDEAGTIIQVRILAKAGKVREALALVENSIDQRQETAALIITKINILRALNEPVEMANLYSHLHQILPDMPVAQRLDEIYLLYKLGRQQAARAMTDEFLRSNDTNLAHYAVLRRIWREFDPVPFDRETIKGAKQWADPLAMAAIGRYFLWNEQWQLADDAYFAFPAGRRAIAFSVHNRAMYGLGRTKAARDNLDAILKRDPGDVDSLLMFARLERDAGRLPKAIEVAQKALDGDPTNPEAYVILAQLHERNKAAWRAAQIFGEGLRQLPQDFLVFEQYMQFLHRSGNKSRAVSASRAFALANPSSVLAWTMLAQQCEWAGDDACRSQAADGKQQAAISFRVDDPPGAPPERGLLGKF